MNRWTAKFLFLIALVASFANAALAQTEEVDTNIRKFPLDAKRGELVIFGAPDASMNGKPDRIAPGIRIRDAKNALVLSGTLVNARLLVNYTRDNIGLIQSVWVLTPEEAKLKLPSQAGQPTGFFSNIGSMFGAPVAAPQDNGSTPYDQLPKYKQ